MTNFESISHKLKQFAKKYYTNQLIKGVILFSTLGLLYFLMTLFIEYFLWLTPLWRTVLFWLFIGVELLLLLRFIGFPLFKLLGLQQGISEHESSKIIGKHFPEVSDKLLNLLQLKNSKEKSDLLEASIEQKSKELSPIPFTKAVNFKGNLKYLKYALIPIVIWLLTLISGKQQEINHSFERVVHHQTFYEPPAPFRFQLTTDKLSVIQGKPLTINTQVIGNVVPEEAMIVFNKERYYMKNNGNGLFSYTFSELKKNTSFYLQANEVRSKNYQIEIIKTPTIENISMLLYYPKHLKKKAESIKHTGNATVPEGTTILWIVNTQQTDSLKFISNKNVHYFNLTQTDKFSYRRQVREPLIYEISSSNKQLSEYEKLQFTIGVIKDEMPQISVQSNIDSITRGTAFFAGQVSDDHGISKLEMVYYNVLNPEIQYRDAVKINSENVQRFFYEFPNEKLKLEKGVDYELFFRVFDNDVVNGYKKVESQRFSYRKKTDIEEKEELLNEQKDYISNLEKSIKNQEEEKKLLEKFQFDLQRKKELNWNDQEKIKNLVKRQRDYKKMMERQSKKLQENFSEKEEKTKSLQEKKEDLQKRIEELKKLEKQQKLLDELERMADKLNKEDLVKKAKELAQHNKQQERSLERILEMTKQFYVEQKMTQISEKLDKLAKKQEELAKKGNTTKEEQEAIKQEFEQLKQDLKELKKENEKLKKPMDIPSLEELKRDTEKQLNEADKALENKDNPKAKQKQKKASKNMKQMSQKMKQSMEQISMEMMQENTKDLRRILENLLTFSFDQEDLMNVFSKITSDHPNFGKLLRKQHHLKTYFEHIDDSLFALSIRVPKLSSEIQDKLANAHYNLNQSLEHFADNQFGNGIKNQHYTMTSANELADMLSDNLDAMLNPMLGSSGKGKGEQKSFSLPDIIQKQGELLEKMKQELGKQGKDGQKKDSKEGQKGEQSNEDMDGEQYKTYQEQAKLREQLEKMVEGKEGGKEGKEGKKAIEQMKQLEDKILERGLTPEVLNEMQRLKYQLLKLKNATFTQGEDEKRESKSNHKTYTNNNTKALEFKKKYFNHTEILNREKLPLKEVYKKKVKDYFMEE